MTQIGGHVFTTTLKDLASGKDLPELLGWLRIKPSRTDMDVMMRRAGQRVNDKQRYKDPRRAEALKTMDLDALEAEVLARCR